jgi:hypothetical protein
MSRDTRPCSASGANGGRSPPLGPGWARFLSRLARSGLGAATPRAQFVQQRGLAPSAARATLGDVVDELPYPARQVSPLGIDELDGDERQVAAREHAREPPLARGVADSFPIWHLELIENAGHYVQFDPPHRLVDAIGAAAEGALFQE